MKIGRLKPKYDLALADLIRVNLKNHSLDIPGTVYFDENLNHLSDYYLSEPDRRYYYVVTDDNDKLIGGRSKRLSTITQCLWRIVVNFKSFTSMIESKEQV